MILQAYVFPGGRVPAEFYDDVYGLSTLRIVKSVNCSWGDDHEITVSGWTQDEIDYVLEVWGKYKK